MDLVWSHGANGLLSHDPQPTAIRWLDPKDPDVFLVSVCEECGYCVWLLTAEFAARYPSRTVAPTARDLTHRARLLSEATREP